MAYYYLLSTIIFNIFILFLRFYQFKQSDNNKSNMDTATKKYSLPNLRYYLSIQLYVDENIYLATIWLNLLILPLQSLLELLYNSCIIGIWFSSSQCYLWKFFVPRFRNFLPRFWFYSIICPNVHCLSCHLHESLPGSWVLFS